MSDFEFFFTLFGLVLGLSVAEVIAGVARLVEERRAVRVGVLTPLLALFLLLDLAAFWLYAWQQYRDAEVTYLALVIGIVISGFYYVAASVVFPKSLADWSDLDDHYLKRRRFILGVITLAGVLLYDVGTLLLAQDGFAVWKASWLDISVSWTAFLYYACLIAIWFSRRRWVNAVALVLIIARYLLLVLQGAWS
ncbi:MAG: hypothetical protein K2X07_11890 [Caulobacteraceae bacterium]|nr:hypothetical protein [Caulobacteraceae bacterium]